MAHRILYILTLLASLCSLTSAWRLVDRYDGSNWQTKFDIYNKGPSNYEFATWVPWADPALVQNQNGKLWLGIGRGSWIPDSGPYAMQLRSKATYGIKNTTGSVNEPSTSIFHDRTGSGLLIVADFAHIPSNKCGVWPGFWLNGLGGGEKWPAGGEIDLIEGVNLMERNQMSIHTVPGCSPQIQPETQSGQRVGETDCGAGKGLVGCGVINNNPNSFGETFNKADGGIIASQMNKQSIKLWQWERSTIPSDLTSIFNLPPNPSNWGKPIANWSGCDFTHYMRDLQIVLDTKFCGGWAGQEYVWPASGCPQRQGQTCSEFVRQNWGSYYDGVHWLVNYIKVYQ